MIQFETNVSGKIELSVIDLNGNVISAISIAQLQTGMNRFEIKLDDTIENGIYLLKVILANKNVILKKIVLLR